MDFFDSTIGTISNKEILGITLGQYILAFLAILLAVLLRRVFGAIVTRVLRRFARRTKTELDDMILSAIEQPIGFAFIVAGLYAAAIILRLPTEPVDVRRFSFAVLSLLVIIALSWLVFRLIDAFSAYFASVAGKTESTLDDQLIPVIRKSLKVFFGVLAFVFAVQNLGYSVASLLAGLGIGGLAIALAAQDTISNFFGSITILLDRPFSVGDWIETGDQEGVVEEIGFRSTRIRTFGKTQLSIPNRTLANSVVNNWSRMPIRRVKMTVGVTYESSAEQMEQAVEGIRTLLREHPEVYQEFFLVYFTDFGESSLDIFVYYFTTTTVWAEYLRIRQEVNVRIMRLLESLGMEVAFPSRTVYLRPESEPQP
ncbi:MAG: mechanosensitive ion channel family protein [Candidatus Latescibacterota bacterium]|nr:MAG: mechanosensitive ion channel family protein [Candidatus Latescibacterota bacterium]